MNATVPFLLVFVLSSVAVSAQTSRPDQTQSQSIVLEANKSDSSYCPINLRAQQRMSGQTLQVNVGRPKEVTQLVHLTVKNSGLVGMISAKITVHGFSPKGRMVAAGAGLLDLPDATKTFNLILVAAPEADVSTNLRLENFSAVTQIDLDSVGYGDGSTWSSTAERSCHVTPDAQMLITSR